MVSAEGHKIFGYKVGTDFYRLRVVGFPVRTIRAISVRQHGAPQVVINTFDM